MTTIIKPNQNVHKINWFLIAIIFILLAIVFNGIFLYNKIVNLQHFNSTQNQLLEKEKLVNIDLKNQIYQLTDSKNLINLANQLNLLKVNNPEFLSIDQQLAKND